MANRLVVINFIDSLLNELNLKGGILTQDYIIHDLDGFNNYLLQMVSALECCKKTWLELESKNQLDISKLSLMCFVLDRLDFLNSSCKYPSSDDLVYLMLGKLFIFDGDKAPTIDQLAFFKKTQRVAARQYSTFEFFEKSLFDVKVVKPTTDASFFEFDHIKIQCPSFQSGPVFYNQDFFSTIPASLHLMTTTENFNDEVASLKKLEHNQQLKFVSLNWVTPQLVLYLQKHFRLSINLLASDKVLSLQPTQVVGDDSLVFKDLLCLTGNLRLTHLKRLTARKIVVGYKKFWLPNLETLELESNVETWGLDCPRLFKLTIACAPDLLDQICETCPSLRHIDFEACGIFDNKTNYKFLSKVFTLTLHFSVDWKLLKRFCNLEQLYIKVDVEQTIGDLSELSPTLKTLSVQNVDGFDSGRLANITELRLNRWSDVESFNKISSPHLKVLECNFVAGLAKEFFISVSLPNLEYLTLTFREPTPRKLELLNMKKLVRFNLTMTGWEPPNFEFNETFLCGVPNLREFVVQLGFCFFKPHPEIFLATPNLEKLIVESSCKFAGLKKLCFISRGFFQTFFKD